MANDLFKVSSCCLKQKMPSFTDEDKAVIRNDYDEKGWNAYNLWKEHLSKWVGRLISKKIHPVVRRDRIAG